MNISSLRLRLPAQLKTRSLRVIALLAIVTVVVGLAQEAARSAARSELRSATTLANVGTHRLRLHCTGSGERTFVLEAGATGFAETWHWVQAELDDNARVCSYDRAGMGLSEPAPAGFVPGHVATDLRQALEAAGEKAPYVLVGHSMGGFFIRDFAARYPQDTEALVFVDTSHEEQLNRFSPDMVAQFRAFPRLLSALGTLSMTGLLRAWNPLEAGAAGLPEEAMGKARLFAGDREHLAMSAAELAQWDAIVAGAVKQRLARGLPVLTVTAGSPVPGSEDFSDMVEPLHRELASRFDDGQHALVEDADHFSILMNETHAAKLVNLVDAFFAPE